MLVFESQTPQELLTEVAEYLRQLAEHNAKSHARTQRDRAINMARANVLIGAAIDLEGAGILTAEHARRLAARTPEDQPDPQAAVETSATNNPERVSVPAKAVRITPKPRRVDQFSTLSVINRKPEN